MTRQEVVISDQLEQALTTAMKKCEYDRVFILADETTARLCVPAIEKVGGLESAYHIVIGATDACKTLSSLTHVW